MALEAGQVVVKFVGQDMVTPAAQQAGRSTEEFGRKVHSSSGEMTRLANEIRHVQGASIAMGEIFDVAGMKGLGMVGHLVSGFAVGGGIGLGIAAVTTGLSAIAEKLSEDETKAQEHAKVAVAEWGKVKDAIDASVKEVTAFKKSLEEGMPTEPVKKVINTEEDLKQAIFDQTNRVAAAEGHWEKLNQHMANLDKYADMAAEKIPLLGLGIAGAVEAWKTWHVGADLEKASTELEDFQGGLARLKGQLGDVKDATDAAISAGAKAWDEKQVEKLKEKLREAAAAAKELNAKREEFWRQEHAAEDSQKARDSSDDSRDQAATGRYLADERRYQDALNHKLISKAVFDEKMKEAEQRLEDGLAEAKDLRDKEALKRNLTYSDETRNVQVQADQEVAKGRLELEKANATTHDKRLQYIQDEKNAAIQAINEEAEVAKKKAQDARDTGQIGDPELKARQKAIEQLRSAKVGAATDAAAAQMKEEFDKQQKSMVEEGKGLMDSLASGIQAGKNGNFMGVVQGVIGVLQNITGLLGVVPPGGEGGGGGIFSLLSGFAPLLGLLHGGGDVGGRGMVTAHSGMTFGGLSTRSDEVLVKAQRGEGMLSKVGRAALTGDEFAALNRGGVRPGGAVHHTTINMMSFESMSYADAVGRVVDPVDVNRWNSYQGGVHQATLRSSLQPRIS